MHAPKYFFLTLSLLAVGFLLQSCNDHAPQFEKQKVQFSLNPSLTYSPGVGDIDLPENSFARISISGSNGESVLSEHEVAIFKSNHGYVTDLVELTRGSYMVTDFVIVQDSVDLFVTPKKGAELATSEADALPYNFSITENEVATIGMMVVNVGDQDLSRFGYASSKAKANSLAISVYERVNGNLILTSATLELRQNKEMLEVFSLNAAVNAIALPGDTKDSYTITAYNATSAKVMTLTSKQLKNNSWKKPLQLVLEPALVLTIETNIDESIDYEELFEFRMEGRGSVSIEWGDGEQSVTALPFQLSHKYVTGNYTAIITGNVDQITDFSGFSYASIISTITGLTNLAALKVYNPSWGAVPIKVDLSNCAQLETINIAKYGAPYETIDLRSDFKLPAEHHIKDFIFDAPSFDITREYISAEELDAMVTNIYNNAVNHNIQGGKFFVNPVVAPTAETQQKLDVLVNDYNWEVGFNDDIYNAYSSASGRSAGANDPDARREKWLSKRFSNADKIIERGRVASSAI